MDYDIKVKERIELKQVEGAVLQVVYVLTSTDKDPYLEQMWLSVRSLRRHNAHTKVVAVTDRVTYGALTPIRKEMLETVDEIIVVDLDPELSGKVRSRLLKTGLREIVEGDFLYIDTDTIIVDSLEQMDYLNQFDLAAVRDRNDDWDCIPCKDELIRVHSKAFDLTIVKEWYNGGLLWAKDVPEVHRFYSLWDSYYRDGLAKGCSQDQPSLAYAQIDTGLIAQLDDNWNVQSVFSPRLYRSAVVFHYFANNGRQFYRFLDDDWMWSLSSGDDEIRIKAISTADGILNNFLLGFDSNMELTIQIPQEAKNTHLFWYATHRYERTSFKIFNVICRIYNKLF